MKADRRHELRENDLAHALEFAKAYLGEKGKNLGLVVVAVAAVVIVVSLAVRSRAANVEDAWNRKGLLSFETPDEGKQSLEKLVALTKESADESFVLASLMDQGVHALRLAQEVELPPDPDLNNRARAAFAQLLSRFPNNPLAVGAAHSGLATVAENDFALDGNVQRKNDARDHLTAIMNHPALETMPFHGLAGDRLKELDKTFTVVRFAKSKPPAAQAPAAITPTPVAAEGVPQQFLQRMRINPDGTLEPVEAPVPAEQPAPVEEP